MKTPIQIALSQFANKELKGKKDNPDILEYFNGLGHNGSRLKDETSWCSAFVNWCCMKSGYEFDNRLNARSHLDYGQSVETPEQGDKVIFWRGSHENEKIRGSHLKKGHVGFFIRQKGDWIYVLGGNQSNRVKISGYHKDRLLGYRRVKKVL